VEALEALVDVLPRDASTTFFEEDLRQRRRYASLFEEIDEVLVGSVELIGSERHYTRVSMHHLQE
jgi:hypothetical protein